MDDSEQNKSEQPSPFKLARAREKGSIARGMDLGFATALGSFLAYVWMQGPALKAALMEASRQVLVSAGSLTDGPYTSFSVMSFLLSAIAKPLIFLLSAVFLIVLLFEIVQTGVVFSATPLKPDFSRLNPAKGLKRIFSVRMLIETGKNIFKMGVYSCIGFLIIRQALRVDIGSIADGGGFAAALSGVSFNLLASFLLAGIVFAVVDQAIVRKDYLKKMRMSRREIRREARDREGDPRLKQRRKQLHGEFVKVSQSLRNLRGADVLITNPEHIALALRYKPDTVHAPVIVSVGTNHIAQRLKRLAFIYGIPVVQNRSLARELYTKAGLNSVIPAHCFAPVAEIYNQIRRKSGVVL